MPILRFSYDVLQLPDGFSMPANPQINGKQPNWNGVYTRK